MVVRAFPGVQRLDILALSHGLPNVRFCEVQHTQNAIGRTCDRLDP